MKNGDIFFSCNENGSFQIWAISPDGNNKRQITSFEKNNVDKASHPFISIDGKKMAYTGFLGKSINIYTCNLDGSDNRKLTNSEGNERNLIPSISPDMKLIVFESNSQNTSLPYTNLWVMNLDGSNQKPITSYSNKYFDMGGKFSPDGKKILFASDRNNKSGIYDVYIMNIDGNCIKRLTNQIDNSFSRSWSPSGKCFVINSQVGSEIDSIGCGELLIMNKCGKCKRNLTYFESNLKYKPIDLGIFPGVIFKGDITPVWSPDGKYIAYCGQTEPYSLYEVFIINIVTKEKKQITIQNPDVNHVSVGWQPIN